MISDRSLSCAGFGILGSCEDQDISEVRAQFETNFFGTLNIIHSSIAYFRKRKAGRYIFYSSTSGALGIPGLGPYCASKYAMEALVESMLYEVDSFGIRSTIVAPGPTREDETRQDNDIESHLTTAGNGTGHTADADRQNMRVQEHFYVKKPTGPYSAHTSASQHVRNAMKWMRGNEPVSVVQSAEIVWQLGHCRFPPLRLSLGTFAVECVRDRLKSVLEEVS